MCDVSAPPCDQILEYSKFSGDVGARPATLDSEVFRLPDVLSNLIDMYGVLLGVACTAQPPRAWDSTPVARL